MRLLDVAELGHPKRTYDGDNEHPGADPEHQEGKVEPSSSPQRASNEHPSRAAKDEETPSCDNDLADSEPDHSRNAYKATPRSRPSYLSPTTDNQQPTTTGAARA